MKWNACSIVRSGQAAFNRVRAAMASRQAGASPVMIDGCQICTNAVLGQDRWAGQMGQMGQTGLSNIQMSLTLG